ncbi:MAG: glycosyltransferase [Hydrocarboniphaga sp.]|uniref:glycosyltransferase family 4 protein n=1 Tax=Hydrocarboniphaga sp. TaxID=2033016 RepID=UPI00260F059F|nr:glycosyltransferase family 4 protein [Hydrocarboniphaga sp.]MDB5971983.1 glycosyltransferase [Hydrocarboniphaga sp.]
MHVAQLNLIRAPQNRDPEEVLQDWHSLPDIAESVASAGVRVSVIQSAAYSHRMTRNDIDYYFVQTRPAGSADQRSAGYARLLSEIGAELLHVHGLGFADEVYALSRRLPKLPILLQDHADRPPRWWRRRRWRRGLSAAAGVAFTALDQAQPFVSAGLLDRRTRLFAIAESPSRFTPGDKASARRASGLFGDPCLLWVGHLNPGKDPMAVLDGVAAAVRQLPGLQLWCCYASAALLEAMRRRIDRDPLLAGRVHLLGRVAHAQVQELMRAADLFVLGSHAESCGYAVMEALACGVTPVVTDIPSFRALTGDGRYGQLWPCGDSAQLAQRLILAVSQPLDPAALRAHFDATLSLSAVGRRWAEAYAQMLACAGTARR